jgi:hypothetical protein
LTKKTGLGSLYVKRRSPTAPGVMRPAGVRAERWKIVHKSSPVFFCFYIEQVLQNAEHFAVFKRLLFKN